jgi:hypothetical protein
MAYFIATSFSYLPDSHSQSLASAEIVPRGRDDFLYI